ncbi:hypothetical protein FHS10_005297 [Mucilaginibacter dorajii]|nr:hypothetical protein [Mucilaginibacter dorajii]
MFYFFETILFGFPSKGNDTTMRFEFVSAIFIRYLT